MKCAILAVALAIVPSTAWAYPTSVVFSPREREAPGEDRAIARVVPEAERQAPVRAERFGAGAREAVMAAYESPLAFDRVGLVGDFFGGVSEVSDVYLGATLALSSMTTCALGAFLDNNRGAPDTRFDGVFGYITASFDATKLFAQPSAATH
jgi:hypothetical protein